MSSERLKRAVARTNALRQKGQLRSFRNAEPIQPAFSEAKAAQEPIEKPSIVPEREKGRIFAAPGEPRNFPHVELITDKFNNAHNDNQHEKQECRNSSMVENEQSKLKNNPPPEMREEPDRKRHLNEMQAERNEVSDMEKAKSIAAAARQKKQNAPRQSRGMKM